MSRRLARGAVACATVISGLVATGVLGEGRAAASGPTPTADYMFQNTLNSSVAGAPPLANLGPGTNTFITDSVNGTNQTVLSYPLNNGVVLSPTTGVISNTVYTIAALVRIDDITGTQPGAAGNGWVRLFDFKNGTSDNGLYEKSGELNFYPEAIGSDSPPPFVDSVYEMVVLTRDSTGLVTAYVDGEQQFSFDDSTTQDAVIDTNNTLRFFRDNETSGPTNEASSGAVAHIELFNTALSASDVASLTPSSLPTVHISPNSGPKGTVVGISGGGLQAGETVKITYKTGLASPRKVSICSATVSNIGTYSCSGTIPSDTTSGAKGAHKIVAKGVTSGLRASTTYTRT